MPRRVGKLIEKFTSRQHMPLTQHHQKDEIWLMVTSLMDLPSLLVSIEDDFESERGGVRLPPHAERDKVLGLSGMTLPLTIRRGCPSSNKNFLQSGIRA